MFKLTIFTGWPRFGSVRSGSGNLPVQPVRGSEKTDPVQKSTDPVPPVQRFSRFGGSAGSAVQPVQDPVQKPVQDLVQKPVQARMRRFFEYSKES